MSRFPGGNNFAFSVHDDTDLSTLENVRPVYDLLTDIGMRTTKSVWPLASVQEGYHGGATLQDAEYLKFVVALQEKGFEIALHNTRNHDATRELTLQGYSEFRRLLGTCPRMHTNHSRNAENIYWGAARFNHLRPLYRAANAFRGRREFQGHIPESRYFWGDICSETIDYVRGFVFRQTNLDRVNPTMPYRDPARPYVKYWFSSCNGADPASFCETISEARQEQLEEEGGVCIMYTHFACGFAMNGRCDLRTTQLLERLARRRGWFVPVSTLLDHLQQERGEHEISPAEFSAMERRWALDTLVTGTRRALDRVARRRDAVPEAVRVQHC